MKQRLFFGLFLLIGLVSFVASAEAQNTDPVFDWFQYQGNDAAFNSKLAKDEYRNPILAGFHPDPSITRAGDDYYLVNSSFSYFPGVPIFHSKDLVHWTQIGHVLKRPSQLRLDGMAISEGIFAPTIRYHHGTFYVITTLVGKGTFMVTTKNPSGSWSDPIWLPEIKGIDPSLFFNDNGKVYIIYNGPPPGKPQYKGHRALWMREYDPETQKIKGSKKLIINGGTDLKKHPIWIEGPHIFKIDHLYYLIAAQGGTYENHSEVVFRSDSLLGHYQPYVQNPILTQRNLPVGRPNPVTSTGHADFVQTQPGQWWAVFLGCQPYRDNYYNTGRETFLLPVHWRKGWPIILQKNKAVPYRHKRPKIKTNKADIARPTTGNFTIRDNFMEQELPAYWNIIRTPKEEWFDTDRSHGGSLTIKARPVSLHSQQKQPSFIGRRQQHNKATVSTEMRYQPEKNGDEAGLVAFRNNDVYLLMAVTLIHGKKRIQLEKRAGKYTDHKSRIIASATLNKAFEGKIFLKIQANDGQYSFYYGYHKNDWKLLKAKADGTIFSTKKAGGFVGIYFGLYAFTKKEPKN